MPGGRLRPPAFARILHHGFIDIRLLIYCRASLPCSADGKFNRKMTLTVTDLAFITPAPNRRGAMR